MKKLPIEVSVKGVVSFPHLYKPDTKFVNKGEDGKYKMDLVIQKEDLPNLKAGIEGGSELITGTEWLMRIERAHKDAGGDASTCPVKDGDKPVDKKGKKKKVEEEAKGTLRINFTSSFPPQLVDTKKNDLPKGVKIQFGDVVKVSLRPNIYDEGMNLYMNAVMLIEKNAGGGAGAFGDDEEGYTNDAQDSDAFGDDDGDAGDSADY